MNKELEETLSRMKDSIGDMEKLLNDSSLSTKERIRLFRCYSLTLKNYETGLQKYRKHNPPVEEKESRPNRNDRLLELLKEVKERERKREEKERIGIAE